MREDSLRRFSSTKVLLALIPNEALPFPNGFRSYIYHPIRPINKHDAHIQLNAPFPFPIPQKYFKRIRAPSRSTSIEDAFIPTTTKQPS